MLVTYRHPQRGMTLLESLIALLVAALGMLGIIHVQLRTLSDTQTTVRRAQAIGLIDDLGERMRVNPNAMGNMGSYVSGWTDALPTPAAPKDCASAACAHSELAAYDLAEWKRLVQRTLPLGDANIFRAKGEGAGASADAGRRQWGVMIRWRENERSPDSDYVDSINAAADGGDVRCGAGYTCHLQYISMAARCAPFKGGDTTRYFCPGS